MSMVKVWDKEFKVYLSEEDIQNRIKELSGQINSDYKEKKPLLIAVLNGSFMFMSDLLKGIDIDCEISFMRLKSYAGLKSDGDVKILLGLTDEVNDREIIIVEDIIDTGNTIMQIFTQLKEFNTKSVRVASFLFKPSAMQFDYKPDYVGFEVENKFFVGYGLDYDGLGRNYGGLYILRE